VGGIDDRLSIVETGKLDVVTAASTYATTGTVGGIDGRLSIVETGKLDAVTAASTYATTGTVGAIDARVSVVETGKLDVTTAALTYATTGDMAQAQADIAVMQTGKVDHVDAGYQNLLTNTATAAQGALADNAYPGSNPSNFVDQSVTNDLSARVEAHTTNQLNPHAVTASQVGAVATNDAKYLAALTNETYTGDFKADGSVAMTGDLNAGGQSITNANDVKATQFTGGGAGITGVNATNATHLGGIAAASYLTNETYLGTITGATIAAGSSDSVVVTGPNAAITWNTNAAYYVDTDTGATNIAAGASDSYTPATRTLTWNTNAAGGGGVSGTTNQIMDVDGVLYTITNAPSAGYILEFNPANSTAWFVAKSSAGTYDHTALTNHNGTADIQHLTAAEKATATNTFVLVVTNGIQATEADGTATVSAVFGTTANTVYDGAQGAAASNLAYIASTNAEAARVIATNKYPNASGIASSNLAYSASTNAEAARVLAAAALPTNDAGYQNLLTNTATKAQGATADAALPKSSTNALAVTALQVTGGSPTNGALFRATNSVGQGTWVILPKVDAASSAAQIFNPSALVVWNTTNQVYGGLWDGTYWTPGIGWVRINAQVLFLHSSCADGKRAQLFLSKNGGDWLYGELAVKAAGHNLIPTGNWLFYNNEATNRFAINCTVHDTSITNFPGVTYNFFGGAVLP
jgi:hypothetical protein